MFDSVSFSFVVERDLRPSPCADLTECKNDAIHRRLLLCTVINVCHCTLSCFPLRLPHAVEFPAVFQVGVAQCSDFIHHSRRQFSHSHLMQHCQVALTETPSNVFTVNSPLLLLDRSIDRSIDRTLRRQFQRRSTQNVGELSGFFPTVKTCISAPPLPLPFSIHCSPCALDVRSNV
jgi:hypothetical protein